MTRPWRALVRVVVLHSRICIVNDGACHAAPKKTPTEADLRSFGDLSASLTELAGGSGKSSILLEKLVKGELEDVCDC